jgi:putative transposase
MAEVQAAYPDLSVRRLCALLGISRSWWYERAQTPEADEAAVALRDAIERIVLAFPGYGYRRVTHALRREGWTINAKRGLRIMREEALLCQLKRRFVLTTDSRHGLGSYPNLLAERRLSRPNQAWVADITYIRLPTAFCYLAAILDAFSRRVVGWELSRHIDTDLSLAALTQAIRRQPASGLIHHSDHGVQYASGRYVERLEAVGARISMAAVGNVYENALAESFFATLKREEVYLREYRTFAEAEANLARFLDDVYNHKRLHSSLGYRPPSEFEAGFDTEPDDTRFLEGRSDLTLALVR